MPRYSGTKYHRQNNRYYKWREGGQGKEILDAEYTEDLEKDTNRYHDHYMERNGQWYVQSKYYDKHIFKETEIPNVEGMKAYEQGEYLDSLFKELQDLPDI